MRSRNPLYPLPKAFSVHINGDHDDHVSRYKSYSLKRNWVEQARGMSFKTILSPNIPHLTFLYQARPSLLDSRIGALEPPLYSTIIHRLLLYQHVKKPKISYINLEFITKRIHYHQVITTLVTGLGWGVTSKCKCLHVCHLATFRGKLMVHLSK